MTDKKETVRNMKPNIRNGAKVKVTSPKYFTENFMEKTIIYRTYNIENITYRFS